MLLQPKDRRYLQCPAAFTIGHLKKFIRMKFNLCDRYQIDLFHTDEALRETYSLMDIAYIYSWRRKGPLRLYYTVFTNPAKRLKTETVPGVNRIIIQEMVNDIDKTKDNKTAIVQDSDISVVKAIDSVIDVRTEIPDKTVDIAVKPESKTEAETPTVSQITSRVNEIEAETKDETETHTVLPVTDREMKISGTKSESESVEAVTDKREVSSTDPSEKIVESTSDGDDSGNFSLEESFDNSMSDVNKSESDDKVNSEKSSSESMIADKTDLEQKSNKNEI